MGFFKKNWKALLMGLIAIVNGMLGFLLYLGFIINAIIVVGINFCMTILYPIIQILETVSDKNEIVEHTIKGWETPKKDIDELRDEVNKVNASISEERMKKEERRKENRILTELINNNVISVKTLENNILDKKFISVLCYQAGFSVRNEIISKKMSDKIRELIDNKKKLSEEGIDLSREYPKMFNDVGFIKLAKHNEFYMIPEENIYPEKLRDLTKISDHLIKRGLIVVDDEWNKIKKLHKKHDKDFYNKIKDQDNPINFNILVMRLNRRDMRHKFILRNDFNKEFNSELSSIINLNKFKTSASEKVTIKNIVSQSSLKILILSLDKKIRDKILELEEIFTKPEQEGGLGIVNFYDYHTKDINALKNILKKKFRKEDKIEEYANLIYGNSSEYKEDLIELGIKI